MYDIYSFDLCIRTFLIKGVPPNVSWCSTFGGVPLKYSIFLFCKAVNSEPKYSSKAFMVNIIVQDFN